MSHGKTPLDIAKIPYEVEAIWRLYLQESVDFWRCLRCGCEYPRDIVVLCFLCNPPVAKDPETEED